MCVCVCIQSNGGVSVEGVYVCVCVCIQSNGGVSVEGKSSEATLLSSVVDDVKSVLISQQQQP